MHSDPYIVLGQGHSGTRLIASILQDNGVFMGGDRCDPATLDLLPADAMYSAARLCNEAYGKVLLLSEFRDLVEEYLGDLPRSAPWGWKLPETGMTFPWLRQLYPKATYLWWVRDPRDVIRKFRVSDNWKMFSMPLGVSIAFDSFVHRAEGYIWQHRCVSEYFEGEPYRFEDVVLDRNGARDRLEEMLCDTAPLAMSPPDRSRAFAWESDPHCKGADWEQACDMLQPIIEELGYD